MKPEKFQSIPKKGIYIAPDADVLGDVRIGERSSVWYHAVIRAESASVTIGTESNIQDGCVLHVDEGHPVNIGDRVTVGHRAVVHGCSIGDDTLIGMGAVILNGAQIGARCIIGAAALVTQGTVIPDGSMAFGSPAKVIRLLTEKEVESNKAAAAEYVKLSEEHFV